jgi:hypothetical protein
MEYRKPLPVNKNENSGMFLMFKTVRQHCSFLDHDDTVFDGIQRVVAVFEVGAPDDLHIVADAAVFVDDGILNMAAAADAERRQAVLLVAGRYRRGFRNNRYPSGRSR